MQTEIDEEITKMIQNGRKETKLFLEIEARKIVLDRKKSSTDSPVTPAGVPVSPVMNAELLENISKLAPQQKILNTIIDRAKTYPIDTTTLLKEIDNKLKLSNISKQKLVDKASKVRAELNKLNDHLVIVRNETKDKIKAEKIEANKQLLELNANPVMITYNELAAELKKSNECIKNLTLEKNKINNDLIAEEDKLQKCMNTTRKKCMEVANYSLLKTQYKTNMPTVTSEQVEIAKLAMESTESELNKVANAQENRLLTEKINHLKINLDKHEKKINELSSTVDNLKKKIKGEESKIKQFIEQKRRIEEKIKNLTQNEEAVDLLGTPSGTAANGMFGPIIREAKSQLKSIIPSIAQCNSRINSIQLEITESEKQIITLKTKEAKVKQLNNGDENTQLIAKLNLVKDQLLNAGGLTKTQENDIKDLFNTICVRIKRSTSWTEQQEFELLSSIQLITKQLETMLGLGTGSGSNYSPADTAYIAELTQKIQELEQRLAENSSGNSSAELTQKIQELEQRLAENSLSNQTMEDSSNTESSYDPNEILQVVDNQTGDIILFRREVVSDKNNKINIDLVNQLVQKTKEQDKQLLSAIQQDPTQVEKIIANQGLEAAIVQHTPPKEFSNLDDETGEEVLKQVERYMNFIEHYQDPKKEVKKLIKQAMASPLPDANILVSMIMSSIHNRLDNFNIPNQVAVSAGDDNNNLINSVWVTGLYGVSKQQNDQNTTGYNAKTRGGVFGGDLKIGDNTIIGATYSNVQGTFKFKETREGDQVKASNHLFSLYAQQQVNDNMFLQAIVSLNTGEATTKNHRFGRVSTGKLKNKGYHVKSSASYNINTGYGLTVTPNVGIRYDKYKEGGYTETGAGIYNISRKSRSSSLVTMTVGTKIITQAIQINKNSTIMPMIHASLERYLSNKSERVQAKLGWQNGYIQNDANTGKLPKMMYNLGASMVIKYKNIEITTRYDYLSKKKYHIHQGSLTVLSHL